MLERQLRHIVLVHYLEVKGTTMSDSPSYNSVANNNEEPPAHTDTRSPTSTLPSPCEDHDSGFNDDPFHVQTNAAQPGTTDIVLDKNFTGEISTKELHNGSVPIQSNGQIQPPQTLESEEVPQFTVGFEEHDQAVLPKRWRSTKGQHQPLLNQDALREMRRRFPPPKPEPPPTSTPTNHSVSQSDTTESESIPIPQGSQECWGFNKEKTAEWTLMIMSLVMEGGSAILDQMGFALMGMVMAFAGLILSMLEISRRARKEGMKWDGRSLLPCFHSSCNSYIAKPFGSVVETFGFAGALWQCFYSTMEYIYARQHLDNPIKMCLLPFIFVLCLVIYKSIGKEQENHNISNP